MVQQNWTDKNGQTMLKNWGHFWFMRCYLLTIFPSRFAGEWVHQCCYHNHWETFRTAFIPNGPGSEWLWHCIICMFGASYLFWWPKKCIKTAMDRYRHDNDGNGFNGIFITAFFGRLIQSNKCRSKCLSHGSQHEHGKFGKTFWLIFHWNSRQRLGWRYY